MSHTHQEGGPTCRLRTKRECDEFMQNHDAEAQVALAATAVERGYLKYHRRDKGLYSQVVRVMAGTQDDLMNDDGNPSQNPWARRLRAAIERYRAAQVAG